jgi:hypothetical protein
MHVTIGAFFCTEQSTDCHHTHEGEKVELEMARREPWLLDPANLPFNFFISSSADVAVGRLGTRD